MYNAFLLLRSVHCVCEKDRPSVKLEIGLRSVERGLFHCDTVVWPRSCGPTVRSITTVHCSHGTQHHIQY